jgi:hypothetical protein
MGELYYDHLESEKSTTEIVKSPVRGHSLTIDHGWRDVADTTLAFIKRFVKA